MKVNPQKLIIKWNKRDRDWWCAYPNRNGRIMSRWFFGAFTFMEQDLNRIMPDGTRRQKTLYDYIREAGYDPDTLRITINKLTEPCPDCNGEGNTSNPPDTAGMCLTCHASGVI